MTQDTPAATLSYELVENDGAPTLHEEIEAIVACLGDDAAALRADNPEDERAANMDAAAALIERLATQADTAAAGGAEIAASVEAELRAKMAAALAVQSPAAMAYRDSTPGLHVGESAFESWYDQYLLTAPVHQSGKQRARDAYAAGMGDPLVAAQSPDSGAGPGEPTIYLRADGPHEEAKGTACPVTGRPYFMHLTHPELGQVPTYGGPYDSYTAPYAEGDPLDPWHERELTVHRYDHDRGHWVEDEGIPLRIIHEEVLFKLEEDAARAKPAALAQQGAQNG